MEILVDMKKSSTVRTAGNNRVNHIEPVKRGFTGHFFNWVGMSYAKLIIKLEARGRNNIPTTVPYVLAANHETYVDGMLIASYLPKGHFKYFSSLAGSDLLTDHGLFGKIIMHVGRGIPLDRYGNPARGLIMAKKQIDKGNILLVHPEGTRSVDGRLGEFQDGACYLAQKANVPLVPVFIDGGYEVFNRHMKFPQGRDPLTKKRRKVIITFGEPLDPNQYDKAGDMTTALEEWMRKQFKGKEIPRSFGKIKVARA